MGGGTVVLPEALQERVMTPSEQRAFYAEALQVRDIGSDEVDLILQAEGIDMNAATVDECKAAIIKHQWVGGDNQWTWTTESIGMLKYLRDVRRELEE